MFAALLSALASNDFATRALISLSQHLGLGRLRPTDRLRRHRGP